MSDCYGCEYYGGKTGVPATTTRKLFGIVKQIDVNVCDECAKWYDSFEAEQPAPSGDKEQR